MYKAYVVSQEALGENHRNTSKLKSLYIKARKKSYPGLGRYPSFDEPEKEHARYESKQVEKSCFPSGLYFKAFSRCIDSTYLLPYYTGSHMNKCRCRCKGFTCGNYGKYKISKERRFNRQRIGISERTEKTGRTHPNRIN